MSDIQFEIWYQNKDFKILEQMKDQFHREYYCRSAWFARDKQIQSLQSQLDKYKKACEVLRESSKDYLYFIDLQKSFLDGGVYDPDALIEIRDKIRQVEQQVLKILDE